MILDVLKTHFGRSEMVHELLENLAEGRYRPLVVSGELNPEGQMEDWAICDHSQLSSIDLSAIKSYSKSAVAVIVELTTAAKMADSPWLLNWVELISHAGVPLAQVANFVMQLPACAARVS
jgi:hypothetical protein